ncbi:hypothetical protein [Bremerella alba]|uniref:Uncharacterized protein n=1 Tax=Bremerella alba TaxID=980252 RepID=A0A7V9A6C6_9BACT|nr:hypothetical protein [Bremerella alba]MBA2114245.1 hypothetical protein [Bremerella alba]
MDGPQITAWTIRLALLALTASIVLRMVRPWVAVTVGWQRAIWTTACGLFLAHIAAGMHYYHDWSNAQAYADTAQQTFDKLGVRFGGGIYVNHLMAILWSMDVVWWWIAPKSYAGRSPRWEQWLIGFLLFIAFNGLIVFKEGPLRIAGLIGFSVLGLIWLLVTVLPAPRAKLAESPD